MGTYLQDLLGIITHEVHRIESLLEEKQMIFPIPDESFTPESEVARQDPDVLKAITTLTAAADQLAVTVRPPHQPLLEFATSFHISSAFGIVLLSHTVEILREAGPQGLHVNEIAQRNGVHPQKLARILRLLTTRFIFNELSYDVFSNNRMSSLLDSGKSVDEILKNPKDKYKGSLGFTSLLETFLDEMYKGAAYMAENITNPRTAHSEEPNETPLNDAFKHNLSLFEWYEQPDNKDRLERFTDGMAAMGNLLPPDLTLQGVNWESLPDGVIVDVGGGNGSASALLLKHFPNIKIIVQDRISVIKEAEKYWAERDPKAISSEKVILEAHDFFTEQPKREVGAFLLRFILHDWSDKYALKILLALRAAVNSAGTTKLIIIDTIVPSIAEPGSDLEGIPGYMKPDAPKPLLPTYGLANSRAYMEDMHMLLAFNGQARTIVQFSNLLRAGRWKLEKVFTHQGNSFSSITASPRESD